MGLNSGSDPAGRPPALRAEVVLGVIEGSDEPFLTTTEIVEHDSIDASRPTVLKRLKELRDEARVKSKEAGGAPVWYAPPNDEETTAATREDGGADETAVPRETYAAVQADLMAAARSALEQVQQEQRQPNGGWGEKARGEAKTWFRYASKAALLSVVLFALAVSFDTYFPSIARSNVPVFDAGLAVIWTALSFLSGLGSLIFGMYAGGVYVFARVGLAEWLEPRISPYFGDSDNDGSD